MILEMQGKGNDKWVVTVDKGVDENEIFELDTRGQVYAFIRAAHMLGIKDEALTVSRTLQAEYGFSGE